MQGYTEEDWHALQEALSGLLLSRLYLGAEEQPDAFFDLRMKKSNGQDVTSMLALLGGMDIIPDPDEKYSDNVYTFMSVPFRLLFRRKRLKSLTVKRIWQIISVF